MNILFLKTQTIWCFLIFIIIGLSSKNVFLKQVQLLLCEKYAYTGQVWWLVPILPALREAEVGGSRGQEFETILANMVTLCLY